ncbi:MAG: hypothetical protein M8835_04845 [marine benthic group bacterium]|nr:hypothetical protein [Gemmatimonadota bacterium]
MRRTERTIRSSADQMRFKPGFSGRVMTRIRELESLEGVGAPARLDGSASDLLYQHLRHAFPRLAAACVVGLLALGTLALVGDTGLAGSPVDALLGLPAETLETAFALGGM